MNVLVLNCGSSSVKFQLIETDAQKAVAGADRALAKGSVENIGGPALLRYEAEGRRPLTESDEILEHKIAVERCLDLLTRADTGVIRSKDEIDAVGHRVVHGGERFHDSALMGTSAGFVLIACSGGLGITTRSGSGGSSTSVILSGLTRLSSGAWAG